VFRRVGGRARLPAVLVLLALVSGWPIAASPGQPADGGQAVVSAVIDGDTVTLADGRQLRLAGVAAPKRPLDRPDELPWPLADAARSALATLVLGKTVQLAASDAGSDRYGRVVAQLSTADGTWVEGELLRFGMARVCSTADDRARVGEMLALEGEARAAGRGLWADPYYRVRSADHAGDAIGSFQLVEGKAVRVATVRGMTYVEFGVDWRSDFTVAIGAPARRLFAKAGLAPDSLAGRRVRVRGWLRSRFGPLIEATHPEQIELLPP
jgi:endonuclease YncB( thermonuclease family)